MFDPRFTASCLFPACLGLRSERRALEGSVELVYDEFWFMACLQGSSAPLLISQVLVQTMPNELGATAGAATTACGCVGVVSRTTVESIVRSFFARGTEEETSRLLNSL